MPMKNPPHPGGVVKRVCLDPHGLTVTSAAKIMGVGRKTLSELVNEKRGISVEMAIRLAKAFGGTPQGWLTQQKAYDLAQIDTRAITVRRYRGKPIVQ